MFCSDSLVNISTTEISNNVISEGDAAKENPNQNFYCSNVPAYTRCRVSSDSSSWNDFCPSTTYNDSTPIPQHWILIGAVAFGGLGKIFMKLIVVSTNFNTDVKLWFSVIGLKILVKLSLLQLKISIQKLYCVV